MHPAERVLDRAGAGVLEHRVVQRIKLVVQLARLFQIVRGTSGLEFGAQLWRNVGGYRDAAHPARRIERQRQFIVTRELAELFAPPYPIYAHAVVGHAGKIAARVLDADYLFGKAPRQFAHSLGLEIGHCPPWHVVQHDRQVDMLGQIGKVRKQPFLRWAVVIRRDAQRGLRAALLGKGHVQQRVHRVVRAAAGDHRHAAGGLFDAQFDHAVMLGVRQRRALASGPARHQRR